MKFKVVAVLIGALALCASSSLVAQDMQTVVVHAKRYAFVPDQITLTQGVPVRLEVVSDDVAHSLRIDGLNVNLKEKAGETAQTVVTPDTIGDFKGKCGVFCGSGHGKMLLTVHVVAK